MTKLADVLKEESYKVAGKPVTLNKGKKADGTDSAALSPSTWTVPSVTGIIVGA